MGEIRLQFAGGGSLVLQSVHYVPDARRSLISIPQLRESGCQVTLTDESFTLQRGQLVLTRGRRGTRRTFLHALNVRDQSLVVNLLPFRGTPSRRRVRSADKQSGTQTKTWSIVQTFADADVEQASSSETQQGQTLHVPRLAATDSLVEPS